MWTTDGRTDVRRTDGRTSDHGHPISSQCEPNGSGELKSEIVKRPVHIHSYGMLVIFSFNNFIIYFGIMNSLFAA